MKDVMIFDLNTSEYKKVIVDRNGMHIALPKDPNMGGIYLAGGPASNLKNLQSGARITTLVGTKDGMAYTMNITSVACKKIMEAIDGIATACLKATPATAPSEKFVLLDSNTNVQYTAQFTRGISELRLEHPGGSILYIKPDVSKMIQVFWYNRKGKITSNSGQGVSFYCSPEMRTVFCNQLLRVFGEDIYIEVKTKRKVQPSGEIA